MSQPPTSSISEETPRRYIYNDVDMDHFKRSPVRQELLQLVSAMGQSCSTSTFQYDPESPLRGLPPALACLHGSLQAIVTWVDDFPPKPQSLARFGNPSFRSFHERLVERSSNIVTALLSCNSEGITVEEACQRGYQAAGENPPNKLEKHPRAPQLQAYLHDAFGHPTRLDYGTGHESSFMVLLYVICKLGLFGGQPPPEETLKAIAISLFSQYLKVTRRVQVDYMLEPAGSHGAWGLDDYHCLPFYFGACQMVKSPQYTPQSVLDPDVLSQEKEALLYMGCIQYIRDLKKGAPFFESSPMLHDISQLPSWKKVSSGLLRLYEGEVLDKRPVVQHFCFGSIFQANWTPSQGPREAPSETFTSGPPMVRAPWASNEANGMPTTRAPWAK